MTDRYAVIGNPIAHSKSPKIHSAFASQMGQDIHYDRILGRDFAADVQAFFAGGGKGLNVTLPFKENAFALANELSQEAQIARAVNTLIPLPNGHLRGENTDGIGLVRDLKNQGIELAGRQILLLGAGGAARGILRPLLMQGPGRLVIANRTPDKALALARELGDMDNGLHSIFGCGLDGIHGQFDLIINATSSGIDDQAPAIRPECLLPGGTCYDLMYAKEPTAFMRWGLAHGAGLVLDGLGMLVEQAAEAFFLWRGLRPDTTEILAKLKIT